MNLPDEILRIVRFVLAIVGVGGLVVAVRYARGGKPYRGNRHPAPIAGASIAAFISLFVLNSVVESTKPKTIATATEFNSPFAPSIEITAPTGWQVEFDRKGPHVNVFQGGSMADAPIALSIESNLSENEFVPASLLDKIKAQLSTMGRDAKTVENVSDTFDNKSALGLLANGGEETFCQWFVKRGARFYSVLSCRSRTNITARHACDALLQRLHWVEPVDMQKSDL